MELRNANYLKLADELNHKNVKAYITNDGDTTYLTFANGTDMNLVQKIIDAHDPTPNPPALSELDILRDYVLDIELRMILKDLEV